MTGRTGGDVVVETLQALGVRRVVGLPGQHALGLFAALRGSGIDLVSARVENNAVFAADGLARATGEVGVVALSTGPGALTSLGALQESYAACVPLLVLVSQVPRAGLGGVRTGLLHQLDDQQAAARGVTKQTWLVRDAAALPDVLAEAWARAQEAPAGPTWVELPEDVLLGPADIPPVALVDPPAPRRREARTESVAAAAALLSGAERPVVLAGGGVMRSPGGPAALVRLAERLDAPVVSTVGGKGAIGFDHPLSAGSWIEDRATTDLLADADVVLAVGTAFGEVTGNYGTLRPRGRVVQVDAEPRVLGSVHDGLGIVADAAAALSALDELLGGTMIDPHRSGAATAAALRESVERRIADQDRELERTVLADLRDAVPDTADTWWDMTVAAYWAWSAWDPRDGRFFSAQASGGLGPAFPGAVGAALGTGRRTLAVSGDGGAAYGYAELATARQHDADVTWLVVDDGGYGILREYLADAFGPVAVTDPTTDLVGPDLVALAESFGVPAVRSSPASLGADVAATFEPDVSGPRVVVLPATLRMFAPTHR